MKKLGILVPIVTPCTRAGQVDPDGLRAVCRDMLGAGCHSLFVGGSTGRGPWFNRTDRSAICRLVADELGGRAPLFAGCMASGLADMLDNASAMADAGAQVAVITAPGYFNYSQAEVETIFRKFADASRLPVMIYDIPVFAGIKLDLELAQHLADHENVVGFKDSSGDLERFTELAQLLDASRPFYLLQGKEHLLADSLALGASGFVVSLVQIDPRPFVTLYRAMLSGDVLGARCVQGFIARMLRLFEDAFERRPETSTLFHLLNCALRDRGVCDNILLDHEGEPPPWLVATWIAARDLCQGAVEAYQRQN